jgi:predicted  nucleic acid-binding Zn-ribbon protein
MSTGGGEDRLPAAWDRLELSLRRLVEDYERWRRRAGVAEDRVRQLQDTLDGLSTGRVDPEALQSRVAELEAENAALKARIEEGAAQVRSILARVRFLEEE